MNDKGFSDKTLSLSVLSQLLRYLESIGIEPLSLLEAAGIDPSLVHSPDSRIPVDAYLAIEEKAAAMTSDPCFGLHVGQFYAPGSWSILDYIVMNSRTLGEGLILSGKYGKIVSYLIKSKLKIRPGEAEVILYVPANYSEISPHCYHTVQAGMVQMMRKLTGKQIAPIRVRFRDPEPDAAALKEFISFFNCPVIFGSERYSMTFDPAIGKTPLPQSDPNLLKYFQSLASDIVLQLEKNGSATEAVISLMVTKLKDKDLSIRNIAREMGMSVRSLQLKLKEEQTVFSDLLLQTREKLARRYLGQNSTVEETSFLLGFSDSSSFRKAFKKWSGCTPGEYRRDILRGSAAGGERIIGK
ncbi:MAG: AraC family transcriptional regulator [Treponemataceae bacterium]